MSQTFVEFIDPIEPAMHSARHRTVEFAPTNDHPLLDMGWSTGILMGIHLFRTYPELCILVDKEVFEGETLAGANAGVDEIAEAISMVHFGKQPPSYTEILEGLIRTSDRVQHEAPVELVQGEFWPLPQQYPTEDYYGGS